MGHVGQEGVSRGRDPWVALPQGWEERLLTVDAQDIKEAGWSGETEESGRGDGREDRKVGGSQSLGLQKGSGIITREEI